MIKRICFFSGGFAFNRLVRMRYYEKIFPKDVEIFLFTTDKYDNGDIETHKKEWNLKRTKVVISDYNPVKTMFELRKFCRKNKIDRLVNLGAPGAVVPFLIATIFRKTDFLIGFYGEAIRKYRIKRELYKKIKQFFNITVYYLAAHLAKKDSFIVYENYKKAPYFFLINKRKIHYLHAPVNTDLFRPLSKETSRKKLDLPIDKKIILMVGRVNYGKCADLYTDLIRHNKDIEFILIGKWMEKEIPRFQRSNLKYFERKTSEELVDFYNAADLVFCVHRDGTQLGIVAEEALACGVPILHSNLVFARGTPAIIRVSMLMKEVDSKIKKFFSLPLTEQESVSNKARKYAEEYCSDDVWAEKYIKFHLT